MRLNRLGDCMELPNYIDPDAWQGFVEMRRAKGSRTPFTDRAAKMALATLAELKAAGHDPNASLDQSTFNGWSGLFMPRKSDIRPAARSDLDRTGELLKKQQAHADEVEAQRLTRMANRATRIRRVA